jgi:hypothetical protein
MLVAGRSTTGYTEWQLSLSMVHSIIRVKSAQAGEGGGSRHPPLFTISTITYKVEVFAPAERADTLPLFLLYPYMNPVGLAHNLEGCFQRKTCQSIEALALAWATVGMGVGA